MRPERRESATCQRHLPPIGKHLFISEALRATQLREKLRARAQDTGFPVGLALGSRQTSARALLKIHASRVEITIKVPIKRSPVAFIN